MLKKRNRRNAVGFAFRSPLPFPNSLKATKWAVDQRSAINLTKVKYHFMDDYECVKSNSKLGRKNFLAT
jgi:hypothetical protein